MEDNGLEDVAVSQGKTQGETSAARFPARFRPETAELLEIWESLEAFQRNELLALARRLTSRQ